MFPLLKVKILHLEDNVQDAELIHDLLMEGGVEFTPLRFDNRADFVHLLGHGNFDLVLADHTGPQFDGLTALSEASKIVPQIPFIFVTGTMNEDVAIDSLRRGATDYVLKHRLGRLLPAVNRAVEEIQRRQEKALIEQQFLQTQKMESLGLLTGEIAHDFNNVLSIVQGYLSVLDDETLPESKREIISTIQQAANRGAALVRQLLTFARKTESQFTRVDINELLADMAKMIEDTFSVSVHAQANLEKNLPPIEADSGQLHQALLNLCVNARDAMPDGGTIRIESTFYDGQTLCERHPTASGDYICITVADTGIGMDQFTHEHLFDPFFTTKEVGKGTGLGLSVVYGVVKSHRGFIEVESKRNEGTAFQIYLPAATNLSHEKKIIAAKQDNLPGGNESILIVEDEEVLRQLLRMFLETKGYQVLSAKDGVEALEIYREQSNHIALILSDLGLPKLGGLQFFKELKKTNPEVKIILCTGFMDLAVRSQILSSGVREIIMKPYEVGEILTKVRAVLDLVNSETSWQTAK